MPILGILASSNFVSATSFESIATVTVGSGGAATITFSSIPSGFAHLQVRCFAQTNRGTFGIDDGRIRLNSDTGSNYAKHRLFGDGSSASADGNSSIDYMETGTGTFATSNATNTFGVAIIDILDYTNTNKNTTIRSLNGSDVNGTVGGTGGRVGLTSGLWMNTNAVTSILIYPAFGSQFNQYSHFALYGIKGA